MKYESGKYLFGIALIVLFLLISATAIAATVINLPADTRYEKLGAGLGKAVGDYYEKKEREREQEDIRRMISEELQRRFQEGQEIRVYQPDGSAELCYRDSAGDIRCR